MHSGCLSAAAATRCVVVLADREHGGARSHVPGAAAALGCQALHACCPPAQQSAAHKGPPGGCSCCPGAREALSAAIAQHMPVLLCQPRRQRRHTCPEQVAMHQVAGVLKERRWVLEGGGVPVQEQHLVKGRSIERINLQRTAQHSAAQHGRPSKARGRESPPLRAAGAGVQPQAPRVHRRCVRLVQALLSAAVHLDFPPARSRKGCRVRRPEGFEPAMAR